MMNAFDSASPRSLDAQFSHDMRGLVRAARKAIRAASEGRLSAAVDEYRWMAFYSGRASLLGNDRRATARIIRRSALAYDIVCKAGARVHLALSAGVR